MPLILADRVLELSTTTGTGSFTLAGSIVGFQTFNSAIGNGNTTYYTIECPTTGDWETGLGTFTSPSTLARTTVYSSSNSGSLVNFGAGTKNVFVDMSATKWTNGKLVVANGGTGASTSDGASENLSTTYTVDNLTALKALTTRPSSVFMKGYSTTGDGGEGLWEWVAGSSATANDGTIVQCTSGTAGRYFRVVGDTLRPEWFGAVGDGVTSDSAAVLAAVDACNNQSILLNPSKTGYAFAVTVPSTSGCSGFISIGGKARVVPPPGSTSSTNIIYCLRSNFKVDNIFFDLPISTSATVFPAVGKAFRWDGSSAPSPTNFLGGWNASTNSPTLTSSVAPAGPAGSYYVVTTPGTTTLNGVSSWADGDYVIWDGSVWVKQTDGNIYFTNNRVVGGGGHVSAGAGAPNMFVCDNVLSDSWRESISIEVKQNGYVQRNVILRAGMYSTGGGSGAIRVSGADNVTVENIIISDNTIKDCMWAISQSSIDCFSPSAKNILITDNILDYNGNGIELKTKTTVTPPATDTYRSHTISNNFIRTRSTGAGITLNSGTGAIPDGKNFDVVVQGNHITTDVMASPGDGLYGISAGLYSNLTIIGNSIVNMARGIAFKSEDSATMVMPNLVVSNNTIKVAGLGIYCSGALGSITNMHFANNDVECDQPFQLRNGTFSTVYATGNTFISNSSYAVEIENITNGLFARNTFIVNAANYGARAVGGVVSATFQQNIIQTDATTGLDAFRIDAGCTVSITDNQVTIPNTKRVYVGSGTVAAANNSRGTATATPTVAGSIGDVYLNSAPSAGGAESWVCTTAGASGAAVYTASLLSPGSISVGSTAISGGTSGRVLYDNGGLVGELVTGTPGKTLTSKSATPTVATWDYLQSTEDYQVIIGTNAMTNPTPGSARFNIAIGTEALRDATTADSTVAIGYHAGADMAVGRAGVFIGYAAGEHVGGGSSNTFLGGFSGRGTASNPLTGVDNTMVGEAAGLHIQGNSNFNVGVGFNALYGLTEASSNTALGTSAGLCLTTTTGNTLVGSTAYEFGNGSSNVVVGQNAGHGLTLYAYTANSVTPAGGTTLYFSDTSNITVGSVLYIGDTLVVGTKATAVNPNVSVDIDIPTIKSVPINTFVTIMPNQHIGSNNVYVGYLAGYSAQGAINDITAVGYGSMRYTQTGLRNTAVGSWTLGSTSSTTMNDCTVVGYRAGWYAAGDSNTSIGSQALRASQTNPLTGTDNTAVGADAMFDIAGTAANNTAVGSSAATNITTGSSNTVIGSSSAALLTTGSSNIIIGPSVNVPSASTSNYLNIGNAIYGTGILGGTVQIGINKTTPTSTLHVGGTLAVDSKTTLSAALTYGGVELSNSVMGTGSMVLSDAPTLTGLIRLDGNIGINVAGQTYYTIYNRTSLTGLTSAYSFRNDPTIQSDVTGAYYGYSSGPTTQASAFTLASIRHFQAFDATIGATSAVTNQFGFYSANLTGATNNYAFYGAVTQATGAYNLYMGGSAFNYMAGNLAVADTPTSYYGFRVGSTLTGAVNAIATYVAPTIQSDVTTSATIFRSTPATQAAAFTLAALTHYSATSTSIGAGSAITNQYGFRAESNLNGATNNYGFFTNLASATGVWAFYGSGTAASYFGGAVTVVGALTYGGATLSNSVTGTGSMVLSNNPTLTGGGTITANNPALTITQTWNNAAVVFQAVKIDVTATAASGFSSIFTVSNSGSPRFDVNVNGQITLRSNANVVFSTRSNMESGADGYMDFYNYVKNGFTGLRLGGTTSSFPMIKVNGANIDFRVADDSAYNAITVNAINVYSTGNAAINWPSRSRISSATDGYVTFMNASASGFTGLQLGGTSASFPMIKVSSTEIQARLADDSAAASFRAANLYVAGISGRIGSSIFGGISVPSDGNITLNNNANNDFSKLQFGGTTSSFPALKKNSTSLETKLADDSAYSNHSALSFTSKGSTWANIPAAGNAGRMQFVSNAGTKGSLWMDDGTRWKPLNGIATLASLDTASANISNSETIVIQTLVPANMMKPGDSFRVYLTFTKSGTTDTGNMRFRLGTAGTTADSLLLTSLGLLSATQRYTVGVYQFKLITDTSTQVLTSSYVYGYSGVSTGALPAAVATSSASANNLYFSISIYSNGTTDTVSLVDAQIQTVASAN